VRTIIFSRHALDRMAQHALKRPEVEEVVRTGELIENYSDRSRPYPSRLVLGFSADRPIHAVAATSADEEITVVVTTYVPDPRRWEPDWKTRKERS
jgi:hypothetical protein